MSYCPSYTRKPYPPRPHPRPRPPEPECPQLPGTLLRIFIPAGATINLLNLLEVTSPSGICLIIRIPVLGGSDYYSSIVNAVTGVGGSVEVV